MDKAISRRRFLWATLVGSSSLVGSALLSAEEDEQLRRLPLPKEAKDRVRLGRTGVTASFLAFGTGFRGYNRSSELTRKGAQAFARVMERVLAAGINFIDMADLYGSHPFVRQHIKELPREQLVLLSKIWPRKASWNNPSGGAKAEVERFLDELGTDYLDVCLIHCMLNDKWPDEFKQVCEELSELKEKKRVRAVGVSCHDLGALKVAAVNPWVDVIFARINHRGGQQYLCDAEPEVVAAVLKKARANGKAVVGMKIFAEGRLTKPEEKEASVRFVIENRLVDAMTIGFLSPEEVDDAVLIINRVLSQVS